MSIRIESNDYWKLKKVLFKSRRHGPKVATTAWLTVELAYYSRARTDTWHTATVARGLTHCSACTVRLTHGAHDNSVARVAWACSGTAHTESTRCGMIGGEPSTAKR
jgi:hypothetical protein